MTRAKAKPSAMSDEKLIHARNEAQRLFMELDAEVDRRESEAAARALFWQAAKTPVKILADEPKRVFMNPRQVTRIGNDGDGASTREAAAQIAIPPEAAQSPTERPESFTPAPDPLEVPACCVRT